MYESAVVLPAKIYSLSLVQREKKRKGTADARFEGVECQVVLERARNRTSTRVQQLGLTHEKRP